MSLAARFKALEVLQGRLTRLEKRTLASLPKEYGFRSIEAFVAAVRKAARVPSHTPRRKQWVRPGGTLQLRRDVAELLAQRKSAIEIALELGLSLRVVDRVMAGIEGKEGGSSREKRPRGRERAIKRYQRC
jgi:hypothetical protein